MSYSYRIGLVHWSNGLVGGQESYVESVLGRLAEAGHELLFYYETESRPEHRSLRIPPNCISVCGGRENARPIEVITAWGPDVLFVNGLLSPAFEARLQQVAPAVFFAHAYYGTCISGCKAFACPGPARPCTRTFGPACLALYFLRRCGGRNPRTMWSHYRLQARRLALLCGYRAILTASEHMRQEYLKHGFAAEGVHTIHYPVEAPSAPPPERPPLSQRTLDHLLFLGRMDANKGGLLLLDALPEVRGLLNRPLQLTIAGDGPDCGRWKAHADQLAAAHPDIRIHFPGWLGESERLRTFDQADLLVVPSVWPEPFGLVGSEAGHRGVPAAAFAVGGIPDWLSDGVNGRLAAADPPTPAKLASAIAACLADRGEYERLSAGARRLAGRFTSQRHLNRLESVFQSVICG